jgi:shikimate dehydrogenase
MEIGGNTRLLAVLGDPVAHSLSPRMHNAACRALGLDAAYVALRVPSASLPQVLDALRSVGAAGNVTVPHKEATERHLTRKTDVCARVGACNTFWSEGGELVGDNTDVQGIRAALNDLGVSGGGRDARWLVAGTGGSARAVAVACADAGGVLRVQSRDRERARAFVRWAESIGARAAAADEEPVDVAINATPLGLRDQDPLPIATALNGSRAPRFRAALDLVYARDGTRWVRAVRAAGIPAQDGRSVLVHQGVAAFARFFPAQPAPVEVMRAAVERALSA